MGSCILLGGSGFVGRHLANHFAETERFDKIYIVDIEKPAFELPASVIFIEGDVRQPLTADDYDIKPEWIFNFAAVHREPGHSAIEYFETNILGARNVCALAEATQCQNIYFTSSISVYGPCLDPTDESKLPMPITPYGASKYPAELIHQNWRANDPSRRLIISRPGVIYGPGDPGNILRMIKAIRRGYFFFPGRKEIRKSYAYIYGFIDSIDFTMNKSDGHITYNYVETPTASIGELARTIKKIFASKAPVFSLPLSILGPISAFIHLVFKSNTFHPVRVRKAATPTHIVPGYLLTNGFDFNYSFEKSIDHWRELRNEDF